MKTLSERWERAKGATYLYSEVGEQATVPSSQRESFHWTSANLGSLLLPTSFFPASFMAFCSFAFFFQMPALPFPPNPSLMLEGGGTFPPRTKGWKNGDGKGTWRVKAFPSTNTSPMPTTHDPSLGDVANCRVVSSSQSQCSPCMCQVKPGGWGSPRLPRELAWLPPQIIREQAGF